MSFTAFSKHILTHNAIIEVIQFWASIAPMISMIKWQCHGCYCIYYYYCYYYYYFVIIVIIIFIIIIMVCRFNEYAGFTWSSCHGGVVRLSLPGLFTCQPACVPHSVMLTTALQVARALCPALCWERVLLTWIPVDTECWSCWSIRSGKYPWCSDLSLCGKNTHSMKARFVLLICKLSPGVVTL